MRKVGDLFEFVSTDTGDCIIHGMMYAPSDGVKWMPKHISLGSILHQATRSTLLVDLLHKVGHIQLRQANPQFGPLTSARYSLFLKEINGTVVLITDLNPDNFMQFTANNLDINDSLLDGKDTFHATQVPGWQRGPNKTKHLANLRPTDRTALVIPEALCRNCRQLISWKTKVSRYLQNLLNRSGILFLYFCLASGILSRNQCFRAQRRQAGRKLKIYWSRPL